MKTPFTFTLPKEITQQRKAFLCEVYIAVFSQLQTEKRTSISFIVQEPFIIYFYARKGSIKNVDRNKGSPIVSALRTTSFIVQYSSYSSVGTDPLFFCDL